MSSKTATNKRKLDNRPVFASEDAQSIKKSRKEEAESGDSESESDDSISERENESSDDSDVESGLELEQDDFLGDEDDEEEEENSAKRPAKKTKNEAMSIAISAILNSKIKAHDRKAPILVRNKKAAKELEESKLVAKAKKALTGEKKQRQDKDRNRSVSVLGDNAAEALAYEKQLRQVAKKGVVRLFNAVLASQTAAGAKQTDSIGLVKKEEKANEMSKESFLELIRTGGKPSA